MVRYELVVPSWPAESITTDFASSLPVVTPRIPLLLTQRQSGLFLQATLSVFQRNVPASLYSSLFIILRTSAEVRTGTISKSIRSRQFAIH
jgi:hypothetical protein